MVRRSTLLLGTVGGAVSAVGLWSLFQRFTTKSVPYTVVARLGETELRRYPPMVAVETAAPTQRTAFGRLFRYIEGDNETRTSISMTAPVELDRPGQTLSMTTPVELERIGSEETATAETVRMAFYLPSTVDVESAPVPLDETVDLVVIPERTLAVRTFSWRPTAGRFARERTALLESLERADVDITAEPFFLGYDAPGTIPFLRRNEVAVEVERDD